jgi:hypothetical protein
MDAPDSDAIYGLEYNLSGSSKQIRGSFLTDGKDGRVNMRSYHGSALFERDEWVHVAWVWGRRLVPQIHGTPKEILMGCIYLNGRRGKAHTFRYENNLPMLPMTMLYIGYPSASSNMDAFVDELRISDVQRYSAEFAPPRRDVELALDEHTRALFHFNGDLKGSCSGFNGDVPAKFEEK